jgi:UDP-glucose 4-epimerase
MEISRRVSIVDNMNVLITGVNGFIGKQLVDYLKNISDLKLYGFGRRDSFDGPSIVYFNGDITDYQSLKKIADCLPDCEIIIHLAALIDMDFDEQKIIDVNCNGTHNICKMAKILSCKKLIYISSIPVIGKPIRLPITEEHPLQPETLYHVTKLAGEHIVNLLKCYDIIPIILRIPSPIGIGMNPKTILPVFMKNVVNGADIELYGKGRRRQNYIDVRDICQAILKAIKSDTEGIFNIASETSYSNYELAQVCINITGSASKICFNGKNDPQEDYSWDISIDKAADKLGYYPLYSLEDTIKWMLSDRKGKR